MPPPPAAVLDVLGSLLDAEYNSMFRFLGEGSPYVSRAIADVRPRLRAMIDAAHRNADRIARTIESLGGIAEPRRTPGEEQFIGYLSLKFLLPKLVDAKEVLVRRYANAIKLGGQLSPDVRAMLQEHLDEHQGDLATLQSLVTHNAA
jgi:hypothetical protein